MAETQELTINGKIFAKYILEGNHLFLKRLISIIPYDDGQSEELLALIIGSCERVEIERLSYLNV